MARLDPTVVRILYVVVSCVSVAFPGILAYIVLWHIMPKVPASELRGQDDRRP